MENGAEEPPNSIQRRQDLRHGAARHELYRERNPRRWSRHTRDWSSIDTVTLNPEREIAVPTGIKKYEQRSRQTVPQGSRQ